VTPTLFIRPQEDLAGAVDWLRAMSPRAEGAAGRSALSDLAEQASGNRVVILVPATCVTLLEAKIPARNRGQLLRAVPYALEEELAGDIEAFHFSVRPGRDGGAHVAVMKREWLQRLLAMLEDLGISPSAVVPESLCLPLADGEWTLLVDEDRCVIRTGPWEALGLDAGDLSAVLGAVEEGAESRRAWHVYDGSPSGIDVDALMPGERLARHERIEDAISLLARQYFSFRPLNLLQGEFAVRHGWQDALKPWRYAAGLAVFIGAVYLAGVALENRQLALERDAARAEMAELYKATFPDAVRVIDPAVQMRSRLQALRDQQGAGGAGFLDMLDDSGRLLMAEDNVEVRLLRYRDGRLELDLRAGSIEQLESLQRSLQEKAFAAELKSVRNEGSSYLARILLTTGTS
jgi:general secretion pathway protein L